ncbi:MAG: stage II sporulation protein D [Gracilibacteraceae bacterium]|nr:stage II sporulation protein D [Gracilibacteraceae bacterium]
MKKLAAAIAALMILLFAIPLLLVKDKTEEQREDLKQYNDIPIDVYMCDMDRVVTMDLEDYILGVVAGEMPASFHPEALKAQALAARTYTMLRMRLFGGRGCSKHQGAEICTDSTHCQAYRNPVTVKKDLDKLKEAVYGTAGEVIIYDNKLIDAVFHSTSGGKTENSEDIWSNRVPYLRSVVSQYEEHSPKYVARQEVSIDSFIDCMKKLDSGVVINKKNIKNEIEILERSEGGRITRIKVGNKVFKGMDVRNVLGLNSSNFNFDIGSSTIRFTVVGNGHGIGMSQYGADGMAKNGASYKDIVTHYYQGVDIVDINSLMK